MSLLPGQIIPETVPIGRLSEDNKSIIIDHNWWLFFYNVALQSIGTGGGLSPSAIVAIVDSETEAADTDAIALQRPLSNLSILADSIPADPVDLSRSLLLAQDALLADPIPLAQPIAAVTPGGSPFAYTAPFAGSVSVTAGTVSAITLTRQGTTAATGLTVGVFQVCRGDILTVTYTGTPTMNFIPWSSQ